jgi:uncharacterized coiled-coil protein SlyX
MDELRRQIQQLNRQVAQLYDIVDRLSYQIAGLIAEKEGKSQQETSDWVFAEQVGEAAYPTPAPTPFPLMMEHKDILIEDDNSSSSPYSYPIPEPTLSPEIQIRRLTAQLTAAYNRIAALEEQLLAARIH